MRGRAPTWGRRFRLPVAGLVDTVNCGKPERSYYCLGTDVVVPAEPVPVIKWWLNGPTARETSQVPGRASLVVLAG